MRVIEGRNNSRSILNRRNKVYIGLLAASMGAALFAFGYYLNHVAGHRFVGDGVEKIGEFLFLIVSLHFTYDWLVRDFDREEHIDLLSSELKPYTDTLGDIKETLNDLFVQTKSVLNLISYSDVQSFEARWKKMAEKHDKFMLIGDVPAAYLSHIPETGAKKKTVSVYRTVNERNRRQLVEAMKMFPKDDVRKVKIYHTGRFDWGYTIIASNRQGTEVEALLNYSSNPNEEPIGYYVFGNTAVAFRNSISSRLADTSPAIYQDESDSPLHIESEDMLEFLLSRRMEFKSLLNEIRQGIPLKGEEAICQQMAHLLAKTKETLHVTHIARGDSIKLLDSPPFKKWLDENYSAAARGVKIIRIFLVQRAEIDNPTLQMCMAQLKSHNVEVRYCFIEDIGPGLCEDFSIYDEDDLVYVSPTAGGAWREERTEARYSCNEARIERYKELFMQLDRASRSFA